MEKENTENYKFQELSSNHFENNISPLITSSNRSSSFDIEECFKNMNSVSDLNPRFAVEIDHYTISYSRD